MSAETMLYPASPDEFIRGNNLQFLADVIGEGFVQPDSLPAQLAVANGPKAEFFTSYLTIWSTLEQAFREELSSGKTERLTPVVKLQDSQNEFISTKYKAVSHLHKASNDSHFITEEGQNLLSSINEFKTHIDDPEWILDSEPVIPEFLVDVLNLIQPPSDIQQ